jgi:hypothetical protein
MCCLSPTPRARSPTVNQLYFLYVVWLPSLLNQTVPPSRATKQSLLFLLSVVYAIKHLTTNQTNPKADPTHAHGTCSLTDRFTDACSACAWYPPARRPAPPAPPPGGGSRAW